MDLELRGKRGPLFLFGVEQGAALPGGRAQIEAQAVIVNTPVKRGEVYRAHNAPNFARVQLTLGVSLGPGWSAFGVERDDEETPPEDFHELAEPIYLIVEALRGNT